MPAAETATFAQRWRDAVAHSGPRPFLIFEGPDGSVANWTYDEFDAVVQRAAGLFASDGVRPGDSIAVALTNSPGYMATWLAAIRLGAWVVHSDPQSTTPELVNHLERTTPALAVHSAARADAYKAAAAKTGTSTLELDEADAELDLFGGIALSTDHPMPSPTDRAALMFTSGTTGTPKGVEITQANYAFTGDVMASAAQLRVNDRWLVVLPFFHANAQYYSFTSAISAGASVALMHTFSASGFLTQAARHEATHASLFAAPMRMILARGPSQSTTSASNTAGTP